MQFSFFYPSSGLEFRRFRFFKAGAVVVSLLMMTIASQVNAFEPPPKSGAPKGTSGGGTRPASASRCFKPDGTTLQTLTPPTGVGYTENQRPQFWVYLPPHQAIELEFTLQAMDSNSTIEPPDSYQVMIPAPQGAGWTALALPTDVPALKQQQTYRWSVALVCNPADRPSNDAVVRGNLIYQPKSSALDAIGDSIGDSIGSIRSDYWLDAMSKMSENNRVNWTKSHGNLNQAHREKLIYQPISNESWKALLLQSRILGEYRALSRGSQAPTS